MENLTPPAPLQTTLGTAPASEPTKFWLARKVTQLSLGYASLTVAAPFILVASLVTFLYNTGKFLYYAATSHKPIKTKNITSLQPPTNLATRTQEQKKAIDTVQGCISDNIEKRSAALKALKENVHSFVISLFSLVPFLGIPAAAAYVRMVSGDKTIDPADMSIRHLFMPFIDVSRTGQLALFPISGIPLNEHINDRFKPGRITEEQVQRTGFLVTQNIQAQPVAIPVERKDGSEHTILCHHAKATHNPTNRTMILLNGQSGTGFEMGDIAAFYLNNSWNVLMVTLGGFPGSDPGTKTSEITAVQDVAAVLSYLKDEKNLGVHGFSIGAALALHASQLTKRIQIVVLDKPFTTPQDVAANCIHQIQHLLPYSYRSNKIIVGGAKILNCIPSSCIRGMVSTSLPPPQVVPGVHPEGEPETAYRTDTFNNQTKVAYLRPETQLVIIGGKYDKLMGTQLSDSQYTRTFSDDLALIAEENGKSLVQVTTDQEHTFTLDYQGKKTIIDALQSTNE